MKFKILAAALCLSLPLSAAPAKAPAKAKGKPAAAAVAAPLRLTSSAESWLKIAGDSTLHKWDAKASKLEISGELKAAGGDLLAQVKSGAVSALCLTITVDGLKSNEGGKMDKNMYAAMESDKFPAVTFCLKSYEVKDDVVAAKGLLTIHGLGKDIEITGKVAPKAGGLNVKGSYDLVMSDFGVKPPVMMLGTVRVKDKVSIGFDYDLLPLK